jgi:PAS domain S-box-containing protein
VLFENLPEAGVFAEVVDGQPVVRRVNPAFAEVFGYDAETAVDHPVNDLIVPEDCRDEARFLDERAVAGSVETREVERVTVSGARRAFRYYGVPLPDAPDGVTRGFAIYTDVTDQRRRAAALERQNERLENLINFVSHDLRNPLGIAQGNLDIARAGGSLNRLDEVDAALDRMDTLIDGLLTLARESTDVTEREHYRLSTIVEGAWRTVETGAATYTVESDGTLLADGGRLRRALENLFRNSVEHGSTGHRASPDDSVEHSSTGSPSEGGGGPDVETASTDGGRPLTVRVGVLPDESGFFVEDDGSGIPEDRREAVFESGYTTNDGGTGFGLAIVHEVVKAHGWSVSVTDGEAGGARFEVTGVEFA